MKGYDDPPAYVERILDKGAQDTEKTGETRLWASVLLTFYIDIEAIAHREKRILNKEKRISGSRTLGEYFTLDELLIHAQSSLTRHICDLANIPYDYFYSRFVSHLKMHQAYSKDQTQPVVFYGKIQAKHRKSEAMKKARKLHEKQSDLH